MHNQVATPLAAPAMGRAVRTARGTAVAVFASLTAAASHALAGGELTWLSVLATTLLALPLTITLTGRAFALWRLTLAVTAAQFVYHWSFAGLGARTAGSSGADPAAHTAHLAQLPAFDQTVLMPALTTSHAGAMWFGHALAATATIALLARGDAALRALSRLVQRVVHIEQPEPILAPVRARIAAFSPPQMLLRRDFFTMISHRGPPMVAA